MKIFKPINRFAISAFAAFAFISCNSDDDAPDEPIVEVIPPIILDCGYFNENFNIHLTDDPNAPVDFIINCDPKINGDLIIDAGVVIAFESNAGLILGKEQMVKYK